MRPGSASPTTPSNQEHADAHCWAVIELYQPDAALIAQAGSVAHGREQARARLAGLLVAWGEAHPQEAPRQPLAILDVGPIRWGSSWGATARPARPRSHVGVQALDPVGSLRLPRLIAHPAAASDCAGPSRRHSTDTAACWAPSPDHRPTQRRSRRHAVVAVGHGVRLLGLPAHRRLADEAGSS